MTIGLIRVRRARRVGGMTYQYTAWEIRSSTGDRGVLRRDNRATRSRLDPINVGPDVRSVEAPVPESAHGGPEVPREGADEPNVGHARRARRLAGVERALPTDDDVAPEHRVGRVALESASAD